MKPTNGLRIFRNSPGIGRHLPCDSVAKVIGPRLWVGLTFRCPLASVALVLDPHSSVARAFGVIGFARDLVVGHGRVLSQIATWALATN